MFYLAVNNFLMRLIRFIPVLLLPFVFMSCMDTREELDIKADGSGTLAVRTDLGKMLEIMKSFGGEDGLKKEGLDKVLDTTLSMTGIVDTAKNITADQKAVLRNGKIHLAFNAQENMGKLDLHFPFSSAAQLKQLYESLNSADGGMKALMGGVGKQPGAEENSGMDMPMPGKEQGLPQITAVYDINLTKNTYSRKVNKQRYEEFAQAMKLDDLKQMGSMLGPMNYTLAIKFPRPIKKINNSKAEMSSDKQTATLAVDLMEIFEHPELLALEIEY
jgi:hypothetical protein